MGIRARQLDLILIVRTVLIALLLAAANPMSGLGQVPAATDRHKSVLFVFNNDSFTATQANIEQALRTTIRNNSAVPVEAFSEFVGDTRTNADYENEFVALIKRKYERKKFDLVFAVTKSPLTILLGHREELFGDSPIVYLTMDPRDAKDVAAEPHATAVSGEVSFEQNLEIALSLQPDARRLVMITGVSATDKMWAQRAKEEFRPFESRLEFSELNGLTVPEMRVALGKLQPDTIVFFVTHVRDHAGNTYESPDYLRQIESSSRSPIYGTTDGQFGNGLIGGSLASFEALGVEGGRVGVRILGGERVDSIEPYAIPRVLLFDWRQMQRWNISEASLPAGSVVRFKQLTLWEQYKWYAVGLITVLVVQTLLIALLLYLRIRRREAEAEAVRLSGRLTEIVSNVPGIVWESRTNSDAGGRTTTFISDYVQRMLGYTAEEWMKQPPGFGFNLVAEEDRERAKRDSEAVVQTGKEGVSEFRWRTKDGGVRWIENHLSPLVDSDSKIIGLRGVALDVTDRKLAEEKAREAEQKDKAILRAIPDLMFIQTLDGIFLDYHAADPRELLVPPESFLGKHAREVFPPELAERFLEAFEKAEEGGGPQRIEYTLNIMGENRWYEARIVRVGDKMLSMVRDITDRVQALEELVKSEERFSRAFRANPQPMSITTVTDGRLIDVNEAFVSVSGYSREEIIGRTTADLGVWKRPEDREAFVSAVTKNGSIVNVETEFQTKDGSSRQLLTSAERLELGGEDCLLVASTDITERYAAQKAVQESEARFRNMAETAPVMIWVSDEHEATTYVNKQWLDLTGRSFDDEMGAAWTQHIHPDDRASTMEKNAQAFKRRLPFQHEFRIRRSDGEYRWVVSTGSPRFSLSREFLGYIGTAIDITDRKRSETELREAHEELRELKNQLEAENIYLQEELRKDQAFGDIVGQSEAIKYVLFKINQVAPTDATVLIIGETGTGKELVARAVHEASERGGRPLIKVNCAALSPTLIESELFGHEKGAFTGAGGRKLGRFELANTGTLLLDEIGELPLDLQSKLLRVLQEGEFERVGGAKTIRSDVRIIASTNRDLKRAVSEGSFREDLWYRLNVFPITTPPLRDRSDDIPILTEHFAKTFARKMGKIVTAVSPDTLTALCAYSWPGNVRELANVIERAVINLRGTVLRVHEDFRVREAETLAASVKTLDDMEREHILRVLEDLRWRIDGPGGAARILGINPSTLRARMNKLGIHKPTGRSTSVASER